MANILQSRWRRLIGAGSVLVALIGVTVAQSSVAVSATRAACPYGDVLPQPRDIRFTSGRLPVTEPFAVAIIGYDDLRLQSAVTRALTRWSERTGLRLVHPPTQDAAPAALTIECLGPGHTVPSLDEDESYALEISAGRAALKAPTVVGAIRGLETLLQLLEQDADGFFLPGVTISDAPRFPWRGLMIDVVRHWQPVNVIERNLDAMALVKLNVLHLHLTDNQGFRIESKRYPEFTQLASDGRFFTQDDIRRIISYATARGIRVVPEFDLPGHAQAWAVAHPELASSAGPYSLVRVWGVNEVVLDPTNEDLYPLLDGFLGEMADLFPDPYLHIGGDENNGRQWNANPRIQAFIREHGLKDNAGLQTYFNQRLAVILAKHKKRMVGWEEILQPGLPADAIIHSWRGVKSLADAARQGYAAILSSGYYIDLLLPASTHYLNDPLPSNTTLSVEEQALVLGGEATMWSEWVTPETIDSRIWPRSAAIAERLWSPGTVKDVVEMYRRLDLVSARLEEGGSLLTANYDPMLRRLLGTSVTPTGLATLRTFVDAVEPVKGGLRRKLQVGVTQQTPLTGVVDCARPESIAARLFSSEVERLLAREGRLDPNCLRQLQHQLQTWSAAGLAVAREIAPHSARLQDAAPVAQKLADLSNVGLAALEVLATGHVPNADWERTQLAALGTTAQTGPSALMLPMLPAVRLLVVAAARQDKRLTLSPDA